MDDIGASAGGYHVGLGDDRIFAIITARNLRVVDVDEADGLAQGVLEPDATEHGAVVALPIDVLPIALEAGRHVGAQLNRLGEHAAAHVGDGFAVRRQQRGGCQAALVRLGILSRPARQKGLAHLAHGHGATQQRADDGEVGAHLLHCRVQYARIVGHRSHP
ncbi:hypothetical protein D3C76_1324390 [compost metagenome]